MSLVIPAKSLEELARIVLDDEEGKTNVEARILNDKNQMLFTFKDVVLSTRLIEGEYPDYHQILPSDKSISCKMSKEAMTNAIKIVNIFARSAIGNKSMFSINGKDHELTLNATVNDVGTNKSSIEVHDCEGDDYQSAFNTKFLAEMVNIMEGDEIVFETVGPTAPGVFKDANDDSFLHIIMPMRLE